MDVFEAAPVVGGACRTEYPFTKGAPGLGQSTGAYLLGVFPPELLKLLDLRLPLLRRDPHYFLPTTGSRHLLFGRDAAATKQQFHSFFSAEDWRADQLMQVRDDPPQQRCRHPLSLCRQNLPSCVRTWHPR